ncbi:MAG TPA: TrkA C-terminal domain-containing protein, partial [Roseiflexaceae bacterium]|nr:TrkA C-terminal domain-containing protein [Roseiflexaceae bacterium]
SMASMALRPAVMELIDLLAHGDELGLWLEELRVEEGSALDGVSIVNTKLREEAGITILAVRQFAGKLLVNPGPDYVLQAHDTLIVLGSSNGIDTTIPFVRSGS